MSQYSIRDCVVVDTVSDVDRKAAAAVRRGAAEADDASTDDAADVSADEQRLRKLIRALERDLDVFVDRAVTKPLLLEKDKQSALAEIAGAVCPASFEGDRPAAVDVHWARGVQDVEDAFRGNAGSILSAMVALRRQQKLEQLRAAPQSDAPVSLTVDVDDDEAQQLLQLDRAAISSLQLLPEAAGSKSGGAGPMKRQQPASLLRMVDRTCTAMGRALLGGWIRRPSSHLPTILARQQCVSFFMANPRLLATLREGAEYLRHFPDLTRLLQRLRPPPSLRSLSATGSRELRDLLELYKCVSRAGAVCGAMSEPSQLSSAAVDDVATHARELGAACDRCAPLLALVEEIIDAEHLQASYGRASAAKDAPSLDGEWLFRARFLRVKPSLTAELAAGHRALEATTQQILSLVAALPAQLGIEKKELHLDRSDVHGVHLRVTKRLSSKVLKALDARQVAYRVLSQQKAGALFLTKPLESLLQLYGQQKQAYEDSQRGVVLEAWRVARTYLALLQAVADKVATLDALASLASVALVYDWTMPRFCEQLDAGDAPRRMELQGLYHPLLRERLGASHVVSSDLCVAEPCAARVIFGPNMGGKSTLLKAVGAVAVLAQIGSAVPCRAAVLPLFDRVFLRSGSAETAALGVSSFLAEMAAMEEVVRLATPRSLVLIDEIGRGTSTADGFGLAWALLEELALANRALVLCATHFHELAALEDEVCHAPGQAAFASLHVDAVVSAETRDIHMLYRLLPGASDRSYGVHCAKVAGFPDAIVRDALAIEAVVVGVADRAAASRKRPRCAADDASDASVDEAAAAKRPR